MTNGCLTSVPDPGTTEPVEICFTLFKPAGASRRHRVPIILHSHGWGGSRTTDPAAFQQWLDARYGVLSFDQRGFGESGGHGPGREPGRRGSRRTCAWSSLIACQALGEAGRHRATRGSARSAAATAAATSSSAAFEQLRLHGKPVFDALAPEITWHDLNRSLAPEGVVRTEWALALSAASAAQPGAAAERLQGTRRGRCHRLLARRLDPRHRGHGDVLRQERPEATTSPRGDGSTIPVLLGQGTTDTLFNLQQGLDNWRTRADEEGPRSTASSSPTTAATRCPAVYPLGVDVTSDPCSQKLAGGDFSKLALRFMDENLKGRDTGLSGYGKLHLATPASTCTTVRSAAADDRAYDVGTVATTETGGVALAFPVAEGPIRIAGSAYLTGTLTALGLNNRAFYGLGVGTTPLDATLVQNNVMPLNELAPVNGEPRRVELPAVAVDVPAGKTLYVIASPVSETFVGTGSRTPGAVVLQDTVAHLPVLPLVEEGALGLSRNQRDLTTRLVS